LGGVQDDDLEQVEGAGAIEPCFEESGEHVHFVCDVGFELLLWGDWQVQVALNRV